MYTYEKKSAEVPYAAKKKINGNDFFLCRRRNDYPIHDARLGLFACSGFGDFGVLACVLPLKKKMIMTKEKNKKSKPRIKTTIKKRLCANCRFFYTNNSKGKNKNNVI